MGDFRIIISISHTDSRPTFTTPGEMTDPDKIMNTEHFWSYLTDIRIRIQINPKIWIIIIIIIITITTTTTTMAPSPPPHPVEMNGKILFVVFLSLFIAMRRLSVCPSVHHVREFCQNE